MADSSKVIYLLFCYYIVVDGSIDYKELEVLETYEKEDYISCKNKIFSDDKDKVDYNILVKSAKELDKSSKIKLKNGFVSFLQASEFVSKEKVNFINTISKKIGVDADNIITSVGNKDISIELTAKSWSDKLSESFYSLLFEIKNSNNADIKSFFSSKVFKTKIKDINKKAVDDIKIAEELISEVYNLLSVNQIKIKNLSNSLIKGELNDGLFKQMDDKILTFNEYIDGYVLQNMKELKLLLEKKKRTSKYFSIAFMGRTKSGKSTFHKVLTESKDSDIGKGRIRTTRYNRVFYWDDLRIIDTPGIGAPNAEKDKKIAETIIDEADIICLLITSDSIQETEFKFLESLKKKNKPLLIILNVKASLTPQRRLDIFLEDPFYWKNREDEQSLQGHFERVNEMISKYYSDVKPPIIPIQLMASLMSQKDENKEISDILYKASNISEFENYLKKIIFRSGHLRKTQNIIDGCNYNIHELHKKIDLNALYFEKLSDSLIEKKERLLAFLTKNRTEHVEKIDVIFNNYVEEIRESISEFVSDNTKTEKKYLKDNWIEHLKEKGFDKKLNNNLEATTKATIDNINKEIEELFTDLKTEMSFFVSGHISSANTTDYKFWSNIIITSSVVALPILGLVLKKVLDIAIPGLGLIITGLGLLGIGLRSLLINKDKRIEKKTKKNIR